MWGGGVGMEMEREREGLTLRGGLRRRVTINDCEIRIRGGRVSVQRGEKNEYKTARRETEG